MNLKFEHDNEPTPLFTICLSLSSFAIKLIFPYYNYDVSCMRGLITRVHIFTIVNEIHQSNYVPLLFTIHVKYSMLALFASSESGFVFSLLQKEMLLSLKCICTSLFQ